MGLSRISRRKKIRMRIRKRFRGTPECPRMSVFRSNKQIYVQLIDDLSGKTIVSASSRNKEVAEKKGINKTDQAREVGLLVARKSLEKGIRNVVFDRSGYLYHGRVKLLAESAREGGLKF